jgi:hypothetical protein
VVVEVYMEAITAYFDGVSFVPIEPCGMKKGTVVKLLIDPETSLDPIVAARLADFERITNNIREINEIEPLPPEFDEILSHRVNFTRDIPL